jgi:hypothetical protein
MPHVDGVAVVEWVAAHRPALAPCTFVITGGSTEPPRERMVGCVRRHARVSQTMQPNALGVSHQRRDRKRTRPLAERSRYSHARNTASSSSWRDRSAERSDENTVALSGARMQRVSFVRRRRRYTTSDEPAGMRARADTARVDQARGRAIEVWMRSAFGLFSEVRSWESCALRGRTSG